MRIAVLRGGPSRDYEISLATGAHMLDHLKDDHDVQDIFIDRDGIWHREGIPVTLARLVAHVDLFINAMHGEYGEDGSAQRLLESLNVAYTGPRVLAASSTWRKDMARNMLAHAGLLVPESRVVSTLDEPYEMAERLHNEIGGQFVIKPITGSASRGVEIVRSYPELGEAISRSLMTWKKVLIEELLRGREVKCVVIDGFRGQELYTFLPVEIERGQLDVYHPDREFRVHSPARISSDEKDLVMQTAMRAHRALGLSHYSSTDMILTNKGAYVLEVDALPPLGQNTIFNKSLDSVGATPREFLNHLVEYSH